MNQDTFTSCGQMMLQSPIDTMDFCLYVTDKKQVIKILCHRSVLLAHSLRLSELINADNFYDLTVEIKPGFINSMLELLQFMYLKDIRRLTDKTKILYLSKILKMRRDFSMIEASKFECNSQEYLHCRLSYEFQNLISLKLAKKEHAQKIMLQHKRKNIITEKPLKLTRSFSRRLRSLKRY